MSDSFDLGRTCVLSILIKFPEFLVCIWVVGYLFRVIRTVICLSFDIVSCVFPLLEIRFPVDKKPGRMGLNGDGSHCQTWHTLFKFALFHELYLNFVTSLQQRRAENCRRFRRIYNPTSIPLVRNIWLSFTYSKRLSEKGYLVLKFKSWLLE